MLLAAIEEQMRVLEAAQSGIEYTVRVKRWHKGANSERLRVDADKRVRSWFFEQDAGIYVQ